MPIGKLRDNSWIRKPDDEDEDVDRDPNYGTSILNPTDEVTTSKTSYVQSVSKIFGGSQDEPKSSTTTTTVTKDGKTTETTITTSQSVRSPVIKSPTKTFTERVQSSSRESQYTNFTPSRTTKVTETTVTSNKDAENQLYDTLIPSSVKDDYSPVDSKTTVSKTETVIVKSSPDTDVEDKLFKTLIPSSAKDDYSSLDRTISSTETVTVRSSTNGSETKTTTRTSSMAEDDLYDTLLPKGITSASSLPSLLSSSSSSITKREIITLESSRGGDSPTLSSPSITRRTASYGSLIDDLPSSRTTSYTFSTIPSDDYTSDRRSYSYTRPDSTYEYSSITSPSITSYSSKSYRSSSRSDDVTDSVYSSSAKSVYAPAERTVLEKDLCSYCHKPFTGDAKMVLDDMKINCHATCFKCQVCHSTLGNMKAGDSLWIYKQAVHCENCFEGIRERWRR
ncbi:sciellin isoform X2 [Plectropomus leopardus]|uniref:sciellin isoform X2 n=1 Tax=Plectropomus leopardus TaxID=160734 RepID=UPI001C4BD992|nr:sciellin isoform X2 [Plectropomus leopardus]